MSTAFNPSAFMTRHVTTDNNRATHYSFAGGADRLCRYTGKWDFSGAEEHLRRSVVALYQQRTPAFVIEKKTPVFRLVEDYDTYGSSTADLLSETPLPQQPTPAHLLALRAAAMCRATDWPEVQFAVFDSSGYSKGRQKPKTSLHVAWQEMLVNSERAMSMRSAFLRHLRTQHPQVEQALRQLDPQNSLESVLDVTVLKSAGVRLPYCDKFHKTDRQTGAGEPEGRVCLPRGLYVYTAAERRIRLMEPPEAVSPDEWVRRGSLRQPPDAVVTPLLSDRRPHGLTTWLAPPPAKKAKTTD